MHSYYKDFAAKYGVFEAVLLTNIKYWIEKNEANDVHFHDGRYWTFNSYPAFHKIFWYVSERQIRTALENLRKKGAIITGNYNERKGDRTIWYALSDEVLGICQNCQTETPDHLTNMSDPSDESVRPLPNINTYINTKENIKRKTVPTVRECEREFTEEVWPLYPRKQGKERAIEKYIMHRRRGTTKEEVIEGIEAYKRYIDRERVGKQFVKQGSTFFSQQAWKDDWGAAKSDLDEVFR